MSTPKLEDWQQAWNVLDNDEEKQTLEQDANLSKMKKMALSKLSESRGANKGASNNVDTDVSEQFLADLKQRFTNGTHIPEELAMSIVKKFLTYLKTKAHAMNIVNTETEGRVVVVGDLHGQFFDLLTVLDLAGTPSPKNKIIFNGDLVDRGPQGPEVLFYIYSLILAYPDYVFLDRGNHEIRRMNEKYSFEEQIIRVYDSTLFNLIIDTFDWLPFTSLIDERILVVHGGLFQYPDVTIQELKNLESERGNNPRRRKKLTTRAEFLVDNLLWSDPEHKVEDWVENSRGAGILFGAQNVKNFTERNNLLYVVRSHQLVDGYEQNFDGKLITVFSASYYTGVNKNKGAIVIFEHEKLEHPKFETYIASFEGSEEAMLKECAKQTLSQLYERIFINRSKLALEFSKIAVNGKVLVEEWGHVLDEVLAIKLNWGVIVNYLAKIDRKGKINYTDFLSRYSVPISEKFLKEVVSSITDKIFESQLALTHVFASYDENGDGKISYSEFVSALKQYNLGLTEDQLYDFMASVDTDKDGTIDFNEFKGRFQVELNTRSGGEKNNNIIEQIALKIKNSGRALSSVFRTYDKDKNNRISFQEFSYMIQREYEGSFSEDDLKVVFAKIDANNSNFISYPEFKDSFTVVDRKDNSWQMNVMQKICDAIMKSKTALKSLFINIDADKSGHIDLEEFKVGLEAMNILLDNPLTNEQITAIYHSIDIDNNGNIDFNEFLTAFSVVQNNTDGLQTL